MGEVRTPLFTTASFPIQFSVGMEGHYGEARRRGAMRMTGDELRDDEPASLLALPGIPQRELVDPL